jgi:hypothetical protein
MKRGDSSNRKLLWTTLPTFDSGKKNSFRGERNSTRPSAKSQQLRREK